MHSILQYCLIIAGFKNGVISIPEYKLRLLKLIDKLEIDNRIKN